MSKCNFLKPKRNKAMEKATRPALDSSSMPKTLHMLYCYVKLDLEYRSSVIVRLDYSVFGNERILYVNMEDITPFCKLMPISYTCILCKYDSWIHYILDICHSTKQDKKSLDELMEHRARALASRLSGTLPNQLVLATCNVGEHWILTVINPHKGLVHLLDLLYRRNHDKGHGIVQYRYQKEWQKTTYLGNN